MRILGLWLLVLGAAQAANDAAFVSQNVPSVMVPGQTYPVTVTMRNTGTTTWTGADGYRLGSQNPEDNFVWQAWRFAPPSAVAPGQEVTFSFNVIAPTTPGTYNFQWKMIQQGGTWFGAQSANVAVKVGLNDAIFVSQSVPPLMTPGQTYPVTVTMKNTGGTTWTASNNYRLGSQNPQDNNTWQAWRFEPPSAIAPGQEATFSFNVTAPSTPGTYNFQRRMLQTTLEWFGQLSTNLAIRVGLDNAAFVSQSVPSSMIAGQNYAVSVTMQNTGSTTWPAGTVLLGSQNAQDNMTWGLNRIALTTPVAPGATRTINFTVTAPSSPGSYNFQWKMLEGPSYWFGAQSTNVAVNVTPSSPDANVFFIHTDHLNTPRLVANSSGTAVWRWDQQEPFGINVPDQNPSALGNFEFNLRFPGQYADKESNLFYNYFRDYDPTIGRYAESDPIGLRGGLNTYQYVRSVPILFYDLKGLQANNSQPEMTPWNPEDEKSSSRFDPSNSTVVPPGQSPAYVTCYVNCLQTEGWAMAQAVLTACGGVGAAAGVGIAVNTANPIAGLKGGAIAACACTVMVGIPASGVVDKRCRRRCESVY